MSNKKALVQQLDSVHYAGQPGYPYSFYEVHYNDKCIGNVHHHTKQSGPKGEKYYVYISDKQVWCSTLEDAGELLLTSQFVNEL